MKTIPIRLNAIFMIGAIAFLTIFITRPASAQESAKKESRNKVIIKIVSDDNGKKTVIDTTMEISDSMMMDSIKEEINKVIILGKGGKHAQFKVQGMPEGFAYDFDMPEQGDLLEDSEELERLESDCFAGNHGMPGCDWECMPGQTRKIIRPGCNGSTLNDLLGDIPMERVTAYSVKDRKHGKRIIIDLNDGPMFERQQSVIVIREPERVRQMRGHKGERTVKVMVDTDDDAKVSKDLESPAPPPPPPPPPAKPQPGKK
ncbi:MAG: hypothetical protein ACOYNC_14095 [Bacteroidales bacterium]